MTQAAHSWLPMTSYKGTTALVTGASAGLGAEFARQLAPDAAALLLVARRVERLEALRDELAERHPGLLLRVLPADLSLPEAPRELAERLDAEGLHVDVLVNNAGLGDVGTLASANWEKIQSCVMVNMHALTGLTHALLPGMIERGSGLVLNVASTAGLMPLPTFAVYAATKAYVNSLTEALAIELRGTGVKISAMCPGPVITEFGDVASRPDGERSFAPPKIMTEQAADVVRETLAAAMRAKVRIVPGGFLIKAGGALMDMMPTPLQRVLLKLGSGSIITRTNADAP